MLTLPRGRKVGPAIFDRRNQELTHGLIAYYSPVLTGPTGLQLLDLSGQDNHSTLTNMDPPTDWVQSRYGRAIDFDGSNARVLLNSKFSILNLRACSVVAWVNARTFGIDGRSVFSLPVADTADTAPFQALNLGFSATRYVNAGVGNGLTRSVFVSTDLQVSANSWNCSATVWDGANLTAGLNGLFSTGSTAAVYTGIGDSGTTGTARIGSYRDEATYSFDGQIAEVAIWNRALTASEFQTLYALEPGGLGRRLRDNFVYLSATAYSLEASTASYAMTGQPIPLLYGRSLPADTGNVLLSGQTASLVTSRLLNADQGSYAYSGTDAATLLGRLLDAGSAAYTLDGTAAGFLASRRISADTVAYLASGLDAGFLRSRVLEAGTGQYVLVASPINITTGTGGAAPYYYLFLLGGSR